MIGKSMIGKSTIGKLLTTVLALALCAGSALSQTGNPAAPAGSSTAPKTSPISPPASLSTTVGGGTRVGTINIEQAIFASNEGRRDFDALSKKLEPKQNELKSQNEELEGLQKRLQTQGPSLNDDARNTLVKQIESKKKIFDRAVQDAQEDASNQQNDIAQKVLQKMAPLIVKYAQDNGFGLIVDTSKPWPQSPVLWYGEAVDITKPVVDAYNTQSGVAPPPSGTATPKPTSAKPAVTTPKPATTPKSNESPK
ncbi:MAG TPA: OmpH family outer membrane protein [Candidatus Sulfotelmatobacter sp.]|nr:OmpH family outer membrane protein [Candidatus Sulfotelmatobacter sp.]